VRRRGRPVRLGLAYVQGGGDRGDERAGRRAAKRGGPFAGPRDLAARAGVRRGQRSNKLAWTGRLAMGLLGGLERRSTLWQLGIAAAAEKLGDGDRGEAGGGDAARAGARAAGAAAPATRSDAGSG